MARYSNHQMPSVERFIIRIEYESGGHHELSTPDIVEVYRLLSLFGGFDVEKLRHQAQRVVDSFAHMLDENEGE